MPWSTIAAVQVIAGNTIINPNGLFMYNSSGPGAGNLEFSVANTGVTSDQFGNTVIGGGAAAYSGTEVSFLSTGKLQFQFAAGDIAGGRAAVINASGTGTLLVQSGVASGLDTPASMVLLSASASGSGQATFEAQAPISLFNGLGYSDKGTAPNDTNAGSTWVSGERAFMNNNWVAYMNNINTNLVNMFG